MPRTPELVPFTTQHLGQATRLLAQRQERLRQVRPELPAGCADPASCEPLLTKLLGIDGAHGTAALVGGNLAAFLIGYPRPEPIWGRACWSPIEGQAYDAALGAEAMRDVYAAWSSHFVDRGFYRHYVHAPADDPGLLDAWFTTGFGKMQAHAVRNLDLAPPDGASFTVRRATPGDLGRIEPLMALISTALVMPPAFAITLPERYATYRDDYAEELSNADARYWLAEEDGRVLGLVGFFTPEPGPMVPDGAWELGDAKTAPAARGRGVARALLAAGFAEARAAGVGHCITDWRTAALPTHRTWTALGFVPTHFRLHRHIDERIAWAGTEADSSV